MPRDPWWDDCEVCGDLSKLLAEASMRERIGLKQQSCIGEARLPVVATLDDVLRYAGQVEARQAGHGTFLADEGASFPVAVAAVDQSIPGVSVRK